VTVVSGFRNRSSVKVHSATGDFSAMKDEVLSPQQVAGTLRGGWGVGWGVGNRVVGGEQGGWVGSRGGWGKRGYGVKGMTSSWHTLVCC
jgi:hypothetical protein